MAKTYWRAQEDGSWEFLGAFRDAHKVDPTSPQAAAAVIMIPGEIQTIVDDLAGRVSLVALPSRIASRLKLRPQPDVTVPWDQLAGFVK